MKKRSEIFNTNLIYFIIMALFVVVRICTAMNVFSFLGDNEDLVLTLVTQVGLMVILPLALFSKLNKKSPKQTFQKFHVKPVGIKTILISLGIGIIVFLLNIAISSFFSYILSLFGYVSGSGGSLIGATWGNFFISLVTVAVLPAICEEFTHRGMLLSSYKTLGFKKTVVLSGIMFGLIHLNVGQFFYASIIGMILAVITLYSNSIFPAIIVHFMNNAISLYLSFAQAKGIFGANFYTTISNYLSSGSVFANLIFVTLILVLLVYLLFTLINMLLKINIKNTVQNVAKNMTLLAMREEVLSDINSEPQKPQIPVSFMNDSKNTPISVKVPYELLGFYMEPVSKPSVLDKAFYWGTIVLGGIVTFFTFIWGIL